jgi:hypothetical protein
MLRHEKYFIISLRTERLGKHYLDELDENEIYISRMLLINIQIFSYYESHDKSSI